MGPLRGRWIDVAQRTIEAGLAALEGRVDDAAAAYAECLDTWTALDLPLDRALTVVDAAMLLPPDARPGDEIERTMDYLRALGARSLLERIEASLSKPSRVRRGVPSPVHRLVRRDVQRRRERAAGHRQELMSSSTRSPFKQVRRRGRPSG
jgi:hypothetical protein